MNSPTEMTDAQLVEMMDTMKVEGKPAEEIGYAIAKGIYGEDSSLLVLKVFQQGIDLAESQQGGPDGFTIGSRKFLNEQLAKFE